jgi:adenine-specific DNA-methyltransferase
MPRKKKTHQSDPNGEEARCKNNPPARILPTYEVRERLTKSYAYDPHLDPQLQWSGKAEHTSFPSPSTSGSPAGKSWILCAGT